MNPTLSVPTDNIYKFACLFGLALIIVSLYTFVTAYSSTLDRKAKYSETISSLEAKETRSKVDEDALALNKKLLEIAQKNEQSANTLLESTFAVGTVLSALGAWLWYWKIQARDDLLAQLQIQKLQAEVANLQADAQPKPTLGPGVALPINMTPPGPP